MASMDQLLNLYNEGAVKIDGRIMGRNKRVARRFVKNFKEYVEETSEGFRLSVLEQGSSFEEVKVFTPSEFDFLLVLFDAPKANIPETIIEDLERNNKKVTDCHTPINVQKNAVTPEQKQFQVDWPDTNKKCLSSQKMVHWFRTWVYNYWEDMIKKKQFKIAGITKIEQPEINTPALTTVLWRETNPISIDMTICVTLDDENYIAKRWIVLDGLDAKRHGMLWFQTFSQDENALMQEKTPKERKCYRIVKAVLSKYIDNAYILKSIFLRNATEEILRTPNTYLNYFISTLRIAYTTQIDSLKPHRHAQYLENPQIKKNLILSYFNPCENILARYSIEELQKSLTDIDRLIRLRDHDPKGYVRELFGEELKKFPRRISQMYATPK